MVRTGSETFPRRLRIASPVEYRRIYDEGRRVAGRLFVLFCRSNDLGYSRLGITVSRKVGRAVVRNRIKRLFREVFRRSRADIPASSDLVVNARRGCAEAGYGELREEFLAAARRASRGPER